jgi:hypothetical protein
MANRGCHPPDLPIFAFNQLDADPARRDSFPEANRRHPKWNLGLWVEHPSAAGQGFAALDCDPTFQRVERLGRGNPLYLDPILTIMFIARIEQSLVQSCFITQQEQSF